MFISNFVINIIRTLFIFSLIFCYKNTIVFASYGNKVLFTYKSTLNGVLNNFVVGQYNDSILFVKYDENKNILTSKIVGNNLQVINCISFTYLYSIYTCFLVQSIVKNVNNFDMMLSILDYEGEVLKNMLISTDYVDTPLNATFLNNNFVVAYALGNSVNSPAFKLGIAILDPDLNPKKNYIIALNTNEVLSRFYFSDWGTSSLSFIIYAFSYDKRTYVPYSGKIKFDDYSLEITLPSNSNYPFFKSYQYPIKSNLLKDNYNLKSILP